MKYDLPSTELIVIEKNNYLKFGEYLNDMQCDDTTNKLCLDDLEYVKKLQQENQELKKQLEEINKFVCKCGYTNIEQVILNYCGLLTQQKEFIKYLEEEINKINPGEYDAEEVYRVYDYETMLNYTILIEVLQKYKSIIGCDE